MDLNLILTIAGSAIAVVAANIGLISWIRGDFKSFETEIRGWKEEIYKEMRDFHGRLCTLEEKLKEKNER